MKIIAKNILFATLAVLAVFSTANAAYCPRGMDGRARDIHFDRGERYGREHAGREREWGAREWDAHGWRAHEGREFQPIRRVEPLPYITHVNTGGSLGAVSNVGFGTKR